MTNWVGFFLREPPLVGGANFAFGIGGLVGRILSVRPATETEIIYAAVSLVAMLTVNLKAASLYADYAGKGRRMHWKLLAVYEISGVVGLACGWVILHAP